MREIRVDSDDRVDSGPVKFVYNTHEDWPGIFIRGDNASYYALIIDYFLNNMDPKDLNLNTEALKSLSNLLRKCRI